jgi:hypothetical protein
LIVDDKRIKGVGEVFVLAFEKFDALGQGFAAGEYRSGGGILVSRRSAAGQRPDQHGGAVAAVAFPQLSRGGDEQCFDLVDRRGAGFDRPTPCG